jgi:chitin disaccharide deacetylase
MKKLIPVSLLLFVITMVNAQQNTIRLLVRGDDMGFSHSANEALIKCYQSGIETSIEVLVASPWFPEAVKMLKQNPGVDIGIHLDLTSEWDNVKWRPLSDCPSLKDSNGYFYPMVWPNKNYPGKSISENKWTMEDVEKEFRAQIELAQRSLPNISHISSHMNCTNISPEVAALTKRLAKEYHIPVEPEADHQGMIGYDGPHGTAEEKIQSFINMLNKLQPGKTYVFVDHPGIDNPELKAVHHIGYENVAEDRQGVTDLFTNEKVKALIKSKGIQLIGYRDLAIQQK